MNPWNTSMSDRMAYILPIVSAAGAIIAGVISFHENHWAAVLGIVAGVSGGLGVIFTGISSRKRDDLLNLTLDTATDALNKAHAGFGGF